MFMELPLQIREIIGEQTFSMDTVGQSGAKVLCFDHLVLKIEEQGEEAVHECRMAHWLAGKLPVPEIVCCIRKNHTQYLLMRKMAGQMACAPERMADPVLLTHLLADGLHTLWQVDITNCPGRFSLDEQLRLAELRVSGGLCSMEDAEPETYGKNGFCSPAHLLQWLKENKPEEEAVFSHGDFSLPNILIERNQISGFLDLGRSGAADRYRDIALCYRSLYHNFSGKFTGEPVPGYHPEHLFRSLGITPDWDKIRYYILLDELF